MKKHNKYVRIKQKIYLSLLLVFTILLGVVVPRGFIQHQKNILLKKEGVVDINSGLPYIGGEKRLYEHLQKVSTLYCTTLEVAEGEGLVVELQPNEAVIAKEIAISQAISFAEQLMRGGEAMGIVIYDTMEQWIETTRQEKEATLYRSTENVELTYWKVEWEEDTIIIDAATGFPVYVSTNFNGGENGDTAVDAGTVYVDEDKIMSKIAMELGFLTIQALNEVTEGMCDMTETFQDRAVYEDTEEGELVTYKILLEDDMNLCMELAFDRERGGTRYKMYYL